MLHDSQTLETPSAFASTGLPESDLAYAEAMEEMYRCEAEVSEAEIEDMRRAAEADGVIDFGPFDAEAWQETMSRFPESTGLTPVIFQTNHSEYPWSAELRRPTPAGPDIVPCLTWRTQKEAWAACVSRAIAMVALVECGKRELAEGMFIKSSTK